MVKSINVSGLIGTQDYLIPYTRTASEALEITPSWRKTNQNGSMVQDIPVAGLIPVSVSLNGKFSDYDYKHFTVGTEVTTAATQTLTAADYALFEEGTYYQNTVSGEILFVISKDSGYSITFKRGLMGTPVVAIATTDVVNVLNTIRLDSASGSETLGKFTLEAGTAALAANDKLIVAIDGIAKEYVMGTDIEVGTSAAAQAANIAAALAQDFPNWGFEVSTADVVGTQKAGYGKPFTLIFNCTAATAANAYTHDASDDTAGVAKTYSSGFGYIIYKEMPRNPVYGQPVYPAYNYNVNGK